MNNYYISINEILSRTVAIKAESNKLTTASLIIKDILKECK